MSSSECIAWIASVPESQKNQLTELRKHILSLGEDIVEEFKWSRPCYSNARGMFCYLNSTKKHATLGFEKGTSLTDPTSLLEGTGKNMRHVKLGPGAKVNSPELLFLLRQAVDQE
jgi:hypothetical protein